MKPIPPADEARLLAALAERGSFNQPQVRQLATSLGISLTDSQLTAVHRTAVLAATRRGDQRRIEAGLATQTVSGVLGRGRSGQRYGFTFVLPAFEALANASKRPAARPDQETPQS
jgi:hypothetical protein